MSSLGSLNILLSLDSIQFNQALDKSIYESKTATVIKFYAILSRKYGRK